MSLVRLPIKSSLLIVINKFWEGQKLCKKIFDYIRVRTPNALHCSMVSCTRLSFLVQWFPKDLEELSQSALCAYPWLKIKSRHDPLEKEIILVYSFNWPCGYLQYIMSNLMQGGTISKVQGIGGCSRILCGEKMRNFQVVIKWLHPHTDCTSFFCPIHVMYTCICFWRTDILSSRDYLVILIDYMSLMLCCHSASSLLIYIFSSPQLPQIDVCESISIFCKSISSQKLTWIYLL